MSNELISRHKLVVQKFLNTGEIDKSLYQIETENLQVIGRKYLQELGLGNNCDDFNKHFNLIQKLGSGQFGEVFLYLSKKNPDFKVAVKKIRFSGDVNEIGDKELRHRYYHEESFRRLLKNKKTTSQQLEKFVNNEIKKVITNENIPTSEISSLKELGIPFINLYLENKIHFQISKADQHSGKNVVPFLYYCKYGSQSHTVKTSIDEDYPYFEPNINQPNITYDKYGMHISITFEIPEYILIVMPIYKQTFFQKLEKINDVHTLDQILKDLIEKVKWLNKAGYNHNDLHLNNIFVLNDNTVRLFDFGSATPIDKNKDSEYHLYKDIEHIFLMNPAVIPQNKKYLFEESPLISSLAPKIRQKLDK